MVQSVLIILSVADPGFPVWGGADPLGGQPLTWVQFSVKTYTKTKELDPVGGEGGARRRRPLDPPMIMAKASANHNW